MTILAWIFLSLFLFSHLSIVLVLTFLSLYDDEHSPISQLPTQWLGILAIIFWEIFLVFFVVWLILAIICRARLDKLLVDEECPGELIVSSDGKSCHCLKCSKEIMLNGFRIQDIDSHTIETNELREFKKTLLYRLTNY